MTIRALTRQIMSRQLDPVDLLERCLEVIRVHESKVRAWVLVDEEGARQQARQIAERIARGETLSGRLLGVPIGVKDIVDVRGLPTRSGSAFTCVDPAPEDAPLVARMRAEGAVILGKTVTTEWASFDPPPTRNPWDLERTPGGSSSGSAAAVALGMCVAAIGSQTGGSINRPASFCGIAGLKPSLAGRPLQGVTPLSFHLDHVGALAKNATDAADVCAALAGMGSPSDSSRDATTSRVVTLAGCGEEEADIGVAEVYGRALDALQRAGITVEAGRVPDSFERAHELHRRIMAVEAAAVHHEAFERVPEQFGPAIGELIQEGLQLSKYEYIEALEHQRQFAADIRDQFGEPGSVHPDPLQRCVDLRDGLTRGV